MKPSREEVLRVAKSCIPEEELPPMPEIMCFAAAMYEAGAADALALPGKNSRAMLPLLEELAAERAVSDRLLDAITDIALAGMSDALDASQESTTQWHARRAWEFIGIAARAKTEVEAMRKEQE